MRRVPEYDAFGREIGEDTLSGWRQGSGAPPPQPAPAEQPAPAQRAAPPQQAPAASVTAGDPLGGTPAAPPPRDPPRPQVRFGGLGRPRKRRRGVRIGLLLVVGWFAFGAISSLVTSVRDTAKTISVPRISIPTPAEVGKEPVGLEAGSMVTAPEFERALGELRGADLGRPQSVRVAPARVDATLASARGRLTSAQVPAGGGLRRFGTTDAAFRNLDTIAWERLDPRIPQRLTRAAARKIGRSPARIDYVLATITGGELTWGAYFKGGAIVIADARGRITRRIS